MKMCNEDINSILGYDIAVIQSFIWVLRNKWDSFNTMLVLLCLAVGFMVHVMDSFRGSYNPNRVLCLVQHTERVLGKYNSQKNPENYILKFKALRLDEKQTQET